MLGTKVYYDSFSGVVKGKIVKVEDGEAHIRVTSRNNRVYSNGSIIKVPVTSSQILPMHLYKIVTHSGIQYFRAK